MDSSRGAREARRYPGIMCERCYYCFFLNAEHMTKMLMNSGANFGNSRKACSMHEPCMAGERERDVLNYSHMHFVILV